MAIFWCIYLELECPCSVMHVIFNRFIWKLNRLDISTADWPNMMKCIVCEIELIKCQNVICELWGVDVGLFVYFMLESFSRPQNVFWNQNLNPEFISIYKSMRITCYTEWDGLDLLLMSSGCPSLCLFLWKWHFKNNEGFSSNFTYVHSESRIPFPQPRATE